MTRVVVGCQDVGGARDVLVWRCIGDDLSQQTGRFRDVELWCSAQGCRHHRGDFSDDVFDPLQ